MSIPSSILLFKIFLLYILTLSNGKLIEIDDAPPDAALPQDLVKVFQDEIQDLRMDLTKSFIAEHSRIKRELLKYSYEASLDTSNRDSFETRTESTGYSSCIYKNSTYVFQNDGLYRLDSESRVPNLVKVTPWTLERGERVLTTQEWDDILFILTTNQDGSYSKLYTIHGSSHTLTSRQQIKNQGRATAALFFIHSYGLYLIIATDNAAHSLTITPIYRWARTYMDQIHEIQTRGAVALVAFPIASYTYIAIAQSQDSTGNAEVGTLVVRVYGKGELEKNQLLWSNEPVSVTYVRFLEEHFLVIGQKKESSICYWFGGYQFIYWQTLEGLFGPNIFLDSFVLPDKEPLLLASTDSSVRLYTRVKNSHVRDSSLLNSTSIVYSTTGSQKIIEARFLKKISNDQILVYLALTIQSYGSSATLKVFPVKLSKVKIGEDQVDPEDKLSGCITSLRNALDDDEPALNEIRVENPLVITKSGDWKLYQLFSTTAINFLGSSNIGIVKINPELSNSEDKSSQSPSGLLSLGDETLGNYQEFMDSKVSQILLKSKPGNITGDFTFQKVLKVKNLESYSPILLEVLNGINWSTLQNDILRTELDTLQIVSGDWEIDTIRALTIQTGNQIGDSYISDFLLTTAKTPQNVKGKTIFNSNIEVSELQIPIFGTINGIGWGDIAFHNENIAEIYGYKSADTINAGDGSQIEYINQMKLGEWYESVLKIDGVDKEYVTGSKVFGDITIDSLTVEDLNGRNWNEFVNSVLLNGINQTIDGEIACGKLKTNRLQVETINGVLVSDWMTISTDQDIQSFISVSDLKIRGNLKTDIINNGVRLSDVILKSESSSRISGPVHLKSLSILNNITLENGVTIDGIDIAQAALEPKKHYYTSKDTSTPLILEGNLQTDHLYSEYLNGFLLDNIRDLYWRSDKDNIIPEDFNFGSAKIIINSQFQTGTFNNLNLESDVVGINTQGTISNNIKFNSDVLVHGGVNIGNGVTLNDYDFSDLEKSIVRTTDGERRVGGRKEFVDSIEAKGGIQVESVNGVSLEQELVWLNSDQEIRGKKKFGQVEATTVQSETDVEVKGLVNGLELKVVEKDTVVKNNQKISVKSDVIFENSIQANDLFVISTVNGFNFKDIVQNSIGLDKPQSLTSSLLVVQGKVTFQAKADVDLINKISPAEYLSQVASKRKDEHFYGTKEFRNVVVDRDLQCRLINNVNLTELEATAFSKTRNQYISGKFTFQELITKGNLETLTLSGIPISSFVRIDQEIKISSDVIFKSTETKTDAISLAGTLNGYRIEELAENLKKIQGNRRFSTITVDGNLSWQNSDTSIQRFSHLFLNAVTRDTDQKILAPVTFATLHSTSIQSSTWINGINLEKILLDSVQNGVAVNFGGRISFEHEIISEGPVAIEGKLETNRVNNINLDELDEQVVRINTKKQISGTKTFTNGIDTLKLNINGEIDNIHPKDLVIVDDKRVIDKIQLQDVNIARDLNYKRINGYDIEKFLKERLTLDGDERLYGDVTFHEDVFVKDCSASSINGLYLSDVFLQDSSTPQIITGSKTFENLKIVGDLENVKLNKVLINEIGEQCIDLSRDEVIDRHIVFTGKVHLASTMDVGHVNKVPIKELAEAFTDELDEIVDKYFVTEETKGRTTELIRRLEHKTKYFNMTR